MECVCPPEPPIDYGRGWDVAPDFSRMTCTRCGGDIRNDQARDILESWTAFEEQRDEVGSIVPASWKGE